MFLVMFDFRPEENNNSSEPSHTIQSVSLAPEDSQTRVSLTIVAKPSSLSQPTSPKNKYHSSQDSIDGPVHKRKNVPSGQGYMQKLVGSLNDLDDDEKENNSMFILFCSLLKWM